MSLTYVMIVRAYGESYIACLCEICMCMSFKTTDQFLLLYFFALHNAIHFD